MQLPETLDPWLTIQGYGKVERVSEITGGCINSACMIGTSQGYTFFLKFQSNAPSFFFESEAEGLGFLHMTCNVRVPKVIGFTDDFLVLDYIESESPSSQFWELLGQQLAAIHQCHRGRFGFVNDNYCGTTQQSNTYHDDGHEFFLQERLLPQARLALKHEVLSISDYECLERLGSRLKQLVPEQNASLLHGDFWSGNVHVGSCGEPVFIDPSVYFGWAEVDIAMTQLFGGFPERFYSAYLEVNPLEKNWRERIDIYNLYPLLNHLNMFGQGYKAQIQDILRRFQ